MSINTKIPKLRRFVLQNFPFIETDFDAITDYQLICKVVEYLNQVIQQINNLTDATVGLIDAFNELKELVENYFENLDVQDEINHKLEEMVEDGTLQEIIINYLQTQAMLVFDTVADMKLATNLVDGSYVRTLGFYSAGDDGGAIYKISDTGTANEKDIIAVGELYAVLVYGKNINVKQFGAKGDGVQDDTAYIQAALDALVTNGSLYFPKGYNYLTSSVLTLSADDVCLYSEPKTEYSTKITGSTANTTIMNVTGYGVTIKNIAFYGDGNYETAPTIDGLNFDRTPLGDAETYCNIDCVVEDCLFFGLDSCITVKGRNARIKNNTFTLCKNGIIGLLHKYSSETETSDFRGYWILENCFHSLNGYSGATTGKTMFNLDSACISMPLESQHLGNINILDNKAEFCGSYFYKGYLPCCQIISNSIYFGIPLLVYSPVEDADLTDLSTRRTALISNNMVNGRGDETWEQNFVYVKGTSNVKLSDNNFRGCNGDGIVGIDTPRFIINNNLIQQYGLQDTEKSGINLSGSGTSYAKYNVINGLGAKYGITSTQTIHMMDNSITADTPINTAGNKIAKDVYATAWATPTLINSFTFGSTYNNGYRKLQNGQVEVQIELKGGTNNANALQLPAGFRPSRNFMLPCVSYNGTPDASIKAYARFYTSGDIRIAWSGTPSANDSYVIQAIFD